MTNALERPSRFPWPVVILVSGWALAVIAHALYPLPFFTGAFAEFVAGAGALVALGAIAILLAALRTLRRAGTTVMPNRRSDHLVTSGPFSFSRNPIYLAFAMLGVAIGLVTGIAWFLPAALLSSWATSRLAIRPEEDHLALRFGKPYRDYAKRVRRWV